ncbi:hypothetical protein BAE44_0020092 [Dichanthelium oligosanthes]|uniref:RecA family profile 1 domain-containing protein n=1 Tax=Dichanthelium oligosanthes TaxID=888268 RepID=A0A1E5V1C5_9POAL|nr:hypothetical protein BAE44_0020092 [Dichanthelium oligosanthes]
MEFLKDVTEKKRFLSTGLEGIDTLLGGGLRQYQLTEVTGPSSSGQTQVCLHSASHFAAKHMGVVMYLDTSNSSSPSRIATIIDGISNLSVQRGRGSMMISVAMILKKLADEHNLSVLVTNHMVSAGNGAVKPALGESWRAVPHVRLLISCESGSNICTATVLKHTLLEQAAQGSIKDDKSTLLTIHAHSLGRLLAALRNLWYPADLPEMRIG